MLHWPCSSSPAAREECMPRGCALPRHHRLTSPPWLWKPSLHSLHNVPHRRTPGQAQRVHSLATSIRPFHAFALTLRLPLPAPRALRRWLTSCMQPQQSQSLCGPAPRPPTLPAHRPPLPAKVGSTAKASPRCHVLRVRKAVGGEEVHLAAGAEAGATHCRVTPWPRSQHTP